MKREISPEQRMWLTILLCMAVVMIWPLIFPPPPAPTPIVAPVQDGSPQPPEAASARENWAPSGSQVSLVETGIPVVDPPRIGLRLPVSTPQYEVTLAETGAVIHRLTLSGYGVRTPEEHDRAVSLVAWPNEGAGHLAVTMDQSDRSGLAQAVWGSTRTGSEVIFQTAPRAAEIVPGIVLEKHFRFSGDYSGEFELRVRNGAGRPVAFSTSRLEYPLEEAPPVSGSFLVHLGPDLGDNDPARIYADQYLVTGAYWADGEKVDAVAERSWWHSIIGMPDPPRAPEWVALQNRYFAVAAVPRDIKVGAKFERDDKGRMHLWLILPAFELAPGTEKRFIIDMYSGPKRTELLAAFSPVLEPLDGMEPVVLPANMAIARWMVALLARIEKWAGNWGVAIVLLTFFVRLVLFPLSHYQFKSMAKMQHLKPKIEEAQSRYANDKERLQRELMKVYQEAGFNPLAGCLPLILQMPILIGLFIALQNATELRGVPFVWWIGDLSIPDTIAHVIGIPINPLPIAMGATMLIQQKMTPTPTTDPAQKQMFTFMTIIMIVMFYNFPSGLTLYWLTQNILSIGQQYYLMRVKKEATDNGK